MSLSVEERQKGIQPLTKDNYLVWSEMIKDYILCLDCEDAEDIWDAAWWDHDAAVRAARAAADAAGDDAEPEPVRTLLTTTMLYLRATLLIRSSRHAMPRHSLTFAVRCHLRSSRRLSDIRPTCRNCFVC